jgi:hypothetical protein
MSNLIAKIKLLWKGRTIATDLIDIKSKWRSVSFWVTLLGNVLSLVAILKGIVPASWAMGLMIANAALTSIYNYIRGLEKAQTDGVAPYKSASEFILAILTTANNAVIDIQTGGVHTPTLAATSIWLTHAVAAARDAANMRPKEAEAAGVEKKPE